MFFDYDIHVCRKGRIEMDSRDSVSERVLFGMLITMAGGLMDAYSYLARGQVFATGQTGNFVLLAIGAANLDQNQVFHYFSPIASFWMGVIFSKYLFHSKFNEHKIHWRRGILYIEIILFILIGFIPKTIPDIIVNSMISFCAALQFCSFRTFGGKTNYASVFCTGNMRSCAEALYLGIVHQEKEELQKGIRYFALLIAFFIGVLVGAVGNCYFGSYAAIIISITLLVALIIMKLDPALENESQKSITSR